jgi:hypothetical protein
MNQLTEGWVWPTGHPERAKICWQKNLETGLGVIDLDQANKLLNQSGKIFTISASEDNQRIMNHGNRFDFKFLMKIGKCELICTGVELLPWAHRAKEMCGAGES